MLSRVRAITLGLLALLVVGAIASSGAGANPGPFWHHRNNSTEGNGLKIEQQSPETFKGTGGAQELKGEVGGVHVRLTTPGVKIAGSIWNNGLQGQIKLELKYPPITIAEPSLPGCQAEAFTQAGAHNVVFSEGHLAWKWNGVESQRTEQPIVNQKPEIVFVPPGTQIQQGATELPTGIFAEVKFSPSANCGVFAGNNKITGSTIGSLKPETVGEWSKTLIVTTPEGLAKQHIWNGSTFFGATTGLKFAGNPASLIGENTTTATTQEISIFEK